MKGEWVRKKPYWWQYYVVGHEQPYANVLRRRGDGPSGPLWDALSTGGVMPLVEGVSLDEAKAAIEQYAPLHADQV